MGAAIMVAVPILILVVLRTVVSLDARFFSPDGHLVVVGGIALCAVTIAIFAAVAARKATQASLVYLSLGSAGVGLLMLGHGLTTPGVLSQPPNPWVGRFPHLALALFALSLMFSGQRADNRIGRWMARRSTPVLIIGIAAEAAITAVFTIDPTIWATPPGEENATDLLSLGMVGICLVVMVRHWRRWHLGHDLVQLALTFAAAMTIAAIGSFQHGVFQQLSWWDYHGYLLAGFGCAVFAIVSRASRHRRIADVLATAFSDEVMTHIANGYPEALVHLVKAGACQVFCVGGSRLVS